ncbi:hypothetical protein DENSPDRAFT_831439 [Dentipellis sp. KUC8613]|nr:hypothetical protein DENSPDRAFT_831439 [Dentipellis sp. KUC8613]
MIEYRIVDKPSSLEFVDRRWPWVSHTREPANVQDFQNEVDASMVPEACTHAESSADARADSTDILPILAAGSSRERRSGSYGALDGRSASPAFLDRPRQCAQSEGAPSGRRSSLMDIVLDTKASLKAGQRGCNRRDRGPSGGRNMCSRVSCSLHHSQRDDCRSVGEVDGDNTGYGLGSSMCSRISPAESAERSTLHRATF